METEQLIRAVYFTLLHSMWQGAAIAFFAGLILIVSKKLSSTSRYNLLAGGLLLFVLSTIITFFTVLDISGPLSNGTKAGLIYTTSIIKASTDVLEDGYSALNIYSNIIVFSWFIIICIKGIEFYLGLKRISDLKTKKIFAPGQEWTTLVNILTKRIGLTSVVRFAESGLTAIPLTVGYLKPVILVPVGMLAAIPTEQVEAILLHELAHIKRQDYLLNIFQSLVEILFFFNPAIWWISNRMRTERENCCDDLAIANSNSSTEYVRALISFEEYRIHHLQLSIAFTGSKNTVLQRTKRIIYNENDPLNQMEKFILTSGLIVSGLLSLAFTDGAKEKISKTLKPVVSTIAQALPQSATMKSTTDTIPASTIHEILINGTSTTFNTLYQGKKYKIVMENDQVADLYVNDTKIAKEGLGAYTSAIIAIVQLNNELSNSDTRSAHHDEVIFEHSRESLSAEGKTPIFRAALAFEKPLSTESFASLAHLSHFSAMSDTLPPAPPSTPATPSAPPANAAVPPSPQIPPAAHLGPRAEMRPALKAIPARRLRTKVLPAIEVNAAPEVKPVIQITPKVAPAIEVIDAPIPPKPARAPEGFESPEKISLPEKDIDLSS